MTSPRQRKKMAMLLARKKKLQEVKTEPEKLQEKSPVVVAPTPSVVIDSAQAQQSKVKKPLYKNALVETKVEETKPVDPLIEQPKQEVKTETKE